MRRASQLASGEYAAAALSIMVRHVRLDCTSGGRRPHPVISPRRSRSGIFIAPATLVTQVPLLSLS
jgi:hypothetical protein